VGSSSTAGAGTSSDAVDAVAVTPSAAAVSEPSAAAAAAPTAQVAPTAISMTTRARRRVHVGSKFAMNWLLTQYSSHITPIPRILVP
jgi:hypothetical protein